MTAKTIRVRRRGRDYAMIAAIAAIFLSVAVMLGIVYRLMPKLIQPSYHSFRVSNDVASAPNSMRRVDFKS